MLGFARDLIVTRGHVEDVVLDGLRAAGFDEAAIVEIVVVATIIFANLVNKLALSAPDICPIVPGKTGQSTREDRAKDSSRSRP